MFEIGKEYKRSSEIHGKFKGQAQGGISTPKDYPVIFIFTSDKGAQHGYVDEYRNDGMFWYTGEGRTGDMKMDSGNKAIRDHAKNNKTIHAFEYTKKSHVQYLGTAECLGYQEERRPDSNGDLRTVFVFCLDINSVPVDQRASESTISHSPQLIKDLKKKTLEQLRAAALQQSPETASLNDKKRTATYRSVAIKLYVIERSRGKCEGCGNDAPFFTKTGPFLECHHVHRFSDGGSDHPQNVIGLCPNCHSRAHYSKDAEIFNNGLKAVAFDAEREALLQ